jgi:hypothetical protein
MSEGPDARTRRVLREHTLPEGLLPPGIIESDITDDGAFSVRLAKRVVRTHGGYRVRFGPKISGALRQGQVRRLAGVDVKQMLWLPVGAIDVDGDALVFTVGPVKQRLRASEFAR